MADPTDPSLLPAPPPAPGAPGAAVIINVPAETPVVNPNPPGGMEPAPSPELPLEKPKASWIWLKDSAGYPSVTVTMLTVSFWVTTVLYIISQFHSIGPIQFRPFDVGACGAYFGSILALYFGRRFTDAKYSVTGGR